jgi:RNA polymerase sigma-70 factor, ECF subfamily
VSRCPEDRRDETDRLTVLITDCQRSLYRYICSLVHRTDDATDVLQETNLALWRDPRRSLAIEDFRPWAYRVAYHQVLAYRKRRARDRLLFDESLLNQLAEVAQARAEPANEYQEALRLCSRKLPPQNRRLLAMRYASALSLQAMAYQLGSSAAAVSQSLGRIRALLLKCVRDLLADNGLHRREQQ